jgi:hypothetical protein
LKVLKHEGIGFQGVLLGLGFSLGDVSLFNNSFNDNFTKKLIALLQKGARLQLGPNFSFFCVSSLFHVLMFFRALLLL